MEGPVVLFMSRTAMSWFWEAKCRVMARPMPLAPPVMMMDFRGEEGEEEEDIVFGIVC